MSEPHDPADALHEELVAYLDGELDAERSRNLEDRLAQDDHARAELQRLEKVWDLLDRLPRANVGDSFAKTTVEMVALAAEQDLAQQRAEIPRRNLRLWLTVAVSILVAGVVGFAGAAYFFPDKNSPLLRDLTVIDQLELLQKGENVTFLQRLIDESTFPPETDNTTEVSTATNLVTPHTDADRRTWLESLGTSERDRLQRQFDRFAELPVAEQDRLRQLESQLENKPELRRVLSSYYEWLKNLQPEQRADILALSVEKRFAEIHRLRDEQAAFAVRREAVGIKLSATDWQGLFSWMEDVAQKHQEQILKDLPADRRKAIEEMPADSAGRRRALSGAALWRWNGQGSLPVVDATEIAALVEKLSPDAKAVLDKQPDPKEKLQIIRDWAHNGMRVRFQGRRPQGGPPISDEMLLAFNESLPKEERERLLNLPREEMLSELRKLYFQKHRGDGSQFRPNGDRPNGQRPGDRPPADHGPSDRPPNDRPPSSGTDEQPVTPDRPPRDRSNRGSS